MATESKNWSGQLVTVYLSTPLSPLANTESKSADVFIVKAKVIEQVGSGLVLDIVKLLDDQQKETSLDAKKIFLPFSKVDYIAF